MPGESHGQRRLEGHSPWGCKDSDTTELMLSHLDKLTSRDGFLNACPVLNFEFFLMTNPRMSLEDVSYRASDLLNTSVHHFGFSGCYGKWPQGGRKVREYGGHRFVTQSCLTLATSCVRVAHQASLSMEFSRQEYWSGLPFPSPVVEGGRVVVTLPAIFCQLPEPHNN